MKITFLWLTMGPYHIARMNALAEVIGKENLHVIEICSLDDHNWDLSAHPKNFNYSFCTNESLSKASIKNSISILKEKILLNKSDVIVNGCGYSNSDIHNLLLSFSKRKEKIILWSESTLKDNRSSFFKQIIKKRRLKLYDAAIVAGKAHKQMLIELGLKDDLISVVGNVVDNETYLTTSVESGKKSNYLFVGRFLKIKQIELLIRAYNDLVNDGDDWDLTLVGDGPERSNLKSIVQQLNIEQRVHFAGLLQQNELINYYKTHAVFVLPSISEPWGLVVNEAMASGTTVIVSNNCGSSEIIKSGKNGFIFKSDDKNDLADKMRLLKEDKALRETMAKNALITINELSPQNYAHKMTSFFESLLS